MYDAKPCISLFSRISFMTSQPLTIWTNTSFSPSAETLLDEGISPHRIVRSRGMSTQEAENALRESDVAFGQPPAETVMSSPSLRWAHITSAGYMPYDRGDLKAALHERGAMFSNSSSVYDEPCAQHVLAMMLADARQLLPCLQAQRGARDWQSGDIRNSSYLLNKQRVLILGFGAIGRRLAQLLIPFDVQVQALRRHPSGDEGVDIIGEDGMESALREADHVINILPDSDSTRGFIDAHRLGLMKRGAKFYNIGRGATVEQQALLQSLESGALALAYLDVTDPEPLPFDHPLWTAPNCFITPHTAGGHAGEHERLVRHFLDNLRLFESGAPLHDRVF